MFQIIMWFCCCLLLTYLAYRWLEVETKKTEIHWFFPKLMLVMITLLSLGYWLFLINAWLFLALTLLTILLFYLMIINAQSSMKSRAFNRKFLKGWQKQHRYFINSRRGDK